MTSQNLTFQRVAVLGLGLMGGSLAKALRKLDPRCHILGIERNSDCLEKARAQGIADVVSSDPGNRLEDRDLIILAMPVEEILGSLGSLGHRLAPGTLVTDVGSTKGRICRQAWQVFPPENEFIGGHPVAGREVSGIEHSDPGILKGAPYVLCPRPDAEPTVIERLQSLVESMGCRPVILSPEEHDRIMARVSHLPQLLSTALAAFTTAEETSVSGRGFRDMTRLAGSSYSVWTGILETNRENIDEALRRFIRHLEELRTDMNDGKLEQEFARALDMYRLLH